MAFSKLDISDRILLIELAVRLEYIRDRGELRRKGGTQGVVADSLLGTIDSNGKVQATFLGKRYQVDALIWFIEHEQMPTGVLLHFNGDNTDNRIGNLRHRPRSTAEQIGARGVCRRTLARILRACKANSRTRAEKTLRYTVEQFRQHIESQFDSWMTRDNHGEWHVDHIKPIAVFLSEGVTAPATINALENLQPLRAADNLSKGMRYE